MELRVENLKIDLGGREIIKNISLHVDKKEIVGIIGPNGSGKSTFLKSIYRTLRPKDGNIYINNREISTISLGETAREMAVVAQHNEQDFDFTVLDMVMIGRTPHKKFLEGNNEEDYKIVKKALKKVDMEDFINRSYNTLSGGEKQRIILARALAQATNCLILDEPTNHLDIRYQFQFMNIAKDLGITVISAIHDLNIASLYCDKIYALKDGRLKYYGKPSEIINEELILDLYGVNSKVFIDEDESVNIIYKPFVDTYTRAEKL